MDNATEDNAPVPGARRLLLHGVMMDYQGFLESKKIRLESAGIEIQDSAIHPKLYPFQRDIVKWACHKGRAAIFLDTGLGKTFIQLEWARLLGERAIVIAPLSVTRQTIREGAKIGIEIRYLRNMDEVKPDCRIYTCNYEMIEALDFSQFGAVVLDESSILKSIAGVTRRYLTKQCASMKYRLCCTATPAPNDQSEIGNHAEFLGVCKSVEMLAMFFIHANKQDEHEYEDGTIIRKKHGNKEGQEWRLKNHARGPFYEWMASWAIAMTRPSELGYSDEGYILPSLEIIPVIVKSDYIPSGELFHSKLKGIQDRTRVRRSTIEDRLSIAVDLVSKDSDQWILWGGLQSETTALLNNIQNAKEVKGDDSQEEKIKRLEDFQDGKYKVLISKPKICGHGMNFQNSHNAIFFGLSDSWEAYYQCIRRQWRYGQKNPVNIYIVISEAEQEVYQNVMRKERVAKLMVAELLRNISIYERKELALGTGEGVEYNNHIDFIIPSWLEGVNDFRIQMPGVREVSSSPQEPGEYARDSEILQSEMQRHSEVADEAGSDSERGVSLPNVREDGGDLSQPCREKELYPEVLQFAMLGQGSERKKESSVERWATFPEWIRSSVYAGSSEG